MKNSIAFAVLVLAAAASAPCAAGTIECPEGYYLKHRAYCVNVEAELSDTPLGEGSKSYPTAIAKTAPPAKSLERIGYDFSGMTDGEFCKEAHVAISNGYLPRRPPWPSVRKAAVSAARV